MSGCCRCMERCIRCQHMCCPAPQEVVFAAAGSQQLVWDVPGEGHYVLWARTTVCRDPFLSSRQPARGVARLLPTAPTPPCLPASSIARSCAPVSNGSVPLPSLVCPKPASSRSRAPKCKASVLKCWASADSVQVARCVTACVRKAVAVPRQLCMRAADQQAAGGPTAGVGAHCSSREADWAAAQS